MFSNYLKLALRVLQRNKFFTGISLFGISFTLTILMLMVAFLHSQFGAKSPVSKTDDLVYMRHLKMAMVQNDTIWSKDSTQVDGIWKYDSTFQNVNNNISTSISWYGKKFLDSYFKQLHSADKFTFIVPSSKFNVYINSVKLDITTTYVDEQYFDIFDFRLLEGNFISKADIDQKAYMAVITSELALKYFGSMNGIIGKQMLVDGKNFTVKGVIEKAKMVNLAINGQLFVPNSILPEDVYETGYFGNYMAVFLAKNGNIDAVKDEIKDIVSRVPFLDPSRTNGIAYNQIEAMPYTFKESVAKETLYMDDASESLFYLRWIVFALIGIFILVPTLNLINLNMSRIMDRSTEIGVRKAFGADSKGILIQFIFENIILTIIGGLLGMIFTIFLIRLSNNLNLLGELVLEFDIWFFILSFFITILFGIISGFIPASKMSKVHIVEALKYK
ncbi:MAG TPA: ABC transporter permease [Saprospiraceae bacterium]|nr:ABC transporter permease [Saprospiraceae bacterium]